MVVFRITTLQWAGKLTASGYAARWNSKGNFVIYTAATRALACLENLIHRSGEGLNKQFKITEIYITDEASIATINPDNLQPGWHKMEMYDYCQEIGDEWIEKQESLLLKVPSSIISSEENLLINPKHPKFPDVNVRDVTPFDFDERLCTTTRGLSNHRIRHDLS